MRTILLTFSPNMTLINEAMRFHHTSNNLGWEPPRDPGTSNFLHSSSLGSHLTCLPTLLSNQKLRGACGILSSHVAFTVKRGKPEEGLMSMNKGANPSWGSRAQNWSTQHPACHSITAEAGKGLRLPEQAPPEPTPDNYTFKRRMYAGLITDVETLSIPFLNHSFKWAGTRKEDILPLTQWASFITLAVLHYSPIIFYFNGIIREVLIWLFCNSENEYQCNIKLLL